MSPLPTPARWLDAEGQESALDWGDACVGHPFSTLLVTLRSMASHHGVAADDPILARVADACTEQGTDMANRATLRRQADLAVRVRTRDPIDVVRAGSAA